MKVTYSVFCMPDSEDTSDTLPLPRPVVTYPRLWCTPSKGLAVKGLVVCSDPLLDAVPIKLKGNRFQ